MAEEHCLYLGLESALRPRGRPRKAPKKYEEKRCQPLCQPPNLTQEVTPLLPLQSIMTRSSGKYVLDIEETASTVDYPFLDPKTGRPTSEGPVRVEAGASINVTSVDKPNMKLTKENKKGSETAKYTTYLMYRPDGKGSIWVTLQIIDWDWSGTASHPFLQSNWSLNPDSTPKEPSTTLTGTQKATLPKWTDYWPNVKFKPK